LQYWRVNRSYLRTPPLAGDLASLARGIRDRDMLITVAFNDAQLATWQALLLRLYVPQAVHVVVDNSTQDDVAEEIRRAVEAADSHYVRSPENPWSARAASRSHGLAMNWSYHNVIRPGRPRAFGFIDHDLFPTAPSDPFADLATQDIYGVVRQVGSRWFLWAGFCMFRFAAVEGKPLNFGQDWFIGLDTGGGNWEILYRHLDPRILKEQHSVWVPFKQGIETSTGPLQWCGTWLHEVGLMGDAGLRAEKREHVAKLLEPHLARIAKAGA
jgi:hypothetical protein